MKKEYSWKCKSPKLLIFKLLIALIIVLAGICYIASTNVIAILILFPIILFFLVIAFILTCSIIILFIATLLSTFSIRRTSCEEYINRKRGNERDYNEKIL